MVYENIAMKRAEHSSQFQIRKLNLFQIPRACSLVFFLFTIWCGASLWDWSWLSGSVARRRSSGPPERKQVASFHLWSDSLRGSRPGTRLRYHSSSSGVRIVDSPLNDYPISWSNKQKDITPGLGLLGLFSCLLIGFREVYYAVNIRRQSALAWY